MNLKGLRVLVVGFGITGLPLVDFLHRKGALITLTDEKNEMLLRESLEKVKNIPMKKILGGHPSNMDVYEKPDLVIVSPGVPLDLHFIQEFKKMNVDIIGEIELAYRYLINPLVAVTGTNGKTTTTALTGEIFKIDGKNPEVVGNIGVPIIEKIDKVKEDQYFVMEVSSFQLETIQKFRPASAAILNITPDHLNRHGSLDTYAALKFRIFENQLEDDVAVINADDRICAMRSNQINSRILYFSRLQPQKNGIFLSGTKMMVRWNGEENHIINTEQIKIPGAHNVENAMAAAGLAIASNVDIEAIKEGLMTFNGVEHRIEQVANINGVSFINDSKATNPDAAMKAIEAVDAPIILLAGGMDKHNDFKELFMSFNQKVAHVFVYGETADQLIQTAKDEKYLNIEKVRDLEEAVHKAANLAKTGHSILLSPACASWDMYPSYEHRGNHFKDIVKQMERKK